MEKQYESDEIEIDLKELFFEVLGEWKKIAISTILLALIMFVISAFVITPQYQSTSKLYVLKNDTKLLISFVFLFDPLMYSTQTYHQE